MHTFCGIRFNYSLKCNAYYVNIGIDKKIYIKFQYFL